jgi:hypothetical protein
MSQNLPPKLTLTASRHASGVNLLVILQLQPGYLRIQVSVIRFRRDPPILQYGYPALNPSQKSLRGYRAGLPQLLANGQQPGTLVALH